MAGRTARPVAGSVTPTIVPGPNTAQARRRVGPVAWCALECLLERSDGGMTVEASVRGIAADLGVAKNTAHRAVAALARAGLIKPIQERDAQGRFRPGRYRLLLGDLVAPTATPAPSRSRQGAIPDAAAAAAQLSLLPTA